MQNQKSHDAPKKSRLADEIKLMLREKLSIGVASYTTTAWLKRLRSPVSSTDEFLVKLRRKVLSKLAERVLSVSSRLKDCGR